MNLKTRIFSSLAAFSTLLIAIWFGWYTMLPLYVLASWVALREFIHMVSLQGVEVRRRSLFGATLVTALGTLSTVFPWLLTMSTSWREVALAVFMIYLLSLEVIRPKAQPMMAVTFSFVGFFYIPWSLSYGLSLRYTPDETAGLGYLLLIFLAVFASDIGGYAFGKLLGRHPLSSISPNKTIEGALGGVGLALVTLWLSSSALNATLDLQLEWWLALLLAVIVSIAAQLGDLFVSLLKRWSGVKDSGRAMPGHGGLLDRLDSVLLALPVGYYVCRVIDSLRSSSASHQKPLN